MIEHHKISRRTYFVIFGALLVLMFLTVAAHSVDLGPLLNITIAMIIAIAKTVLIILYFMHVRFNSRLTQLMAGASFLFLLILFGFTMADYLARGWPPEPGGPLSLLLHSWLG